MKKIFLIYSLSIILISCSDKNSKKKIDSNEKHQIEKTVTQKKTEEKEFNLDLDTISIYNSQINNKTWSEIELGGKPEIALTLYAYRILFTNQLEGKNDCVINYNLIEDSEKVKEIFPKLFKEKSEFIDFEKLLDSLNIENINRAKREVQNDIKEYGMSDGPCFELSKVELIE